MGYVNNNLMNGETVVYRAKMHWLRYRWAVAWFLFAVVCVSADAPVPAVFSFLFAGALALGAYLEIATSEFVVTNKRVFLKQGIMRRRSTELLLGKIESVNVEQGILGRLFDFGTIVSSGTGGTRQGFRDIAKPLLLRQKVNEQVDQSMTAAVH